MSIATLCVLHPSDPAPIVLTLHYASLQRGLTPLHVAADYAPLKVVQALLMAGAGVNVPDEVRSVLLCCPLPFYTGPRMLHLRRAMLRGCSDRTALTRAWL